MNQLKNLQTTKARIPICTTAFLLSLLFARASSASPVFARLYGTSCTTCHLDFPKLNDFGKAFKAAGFKFPKDDESTLKVPPVMLGAETNKEAFPFRMARELPRLPPIRMRMNTFFQYTGPKTAVITALLRANSCPHHTEH